MTDRPIDSHPQRPVRGGLLSPNHYFLERYLVALGTILTSIAIALGAARSIGPGVMKTRAVDRSLRTGIDYTPTAVYREARTKITNWHQHDPWAPLHEQFGQLTLAYLTWEPILFVLVACGLLAVGLQRGSVR